LEAKLKAVKLEVKKEAAATKLQVQQERTKRQRRDDSDADEESSSEDERPKKRVLTTIDKWQNKGHRRAALSAAKKKIVENVTVESWAEAQLMMQEYGFAVVENLTDLFSPHSQPTAEQRDYILQRISFYVH
jgi:hypothetical protein